MRGIGTLKKSILLTVGTGMLSFLLSFSASAYSQRKCSNSARGNVFYARLGISTTQFTSSWGGCSMFGAEEIRKEFLATNLRSVESDVVKGSGEYLNALAELYGCDSRGSVELAKSLKASYSNLFLVPNSARIDREILLLINSDPRVRTNCSI